MCAMLSCSVASDSCNPTDCSPPGFAGHGIFETEILEWVAIIIYLNKFWDLSHHELFWKFHFSLFYIMLYKLFLKNNICYLLV